MKHWTTSTMVMLVIIAARLSSYGSAQSSVSRAYLSPSCVAATADGRLLFVGCATANSVLCIDARRRAVLKTVQVENPPTGVRLSIDSKELFVTCAAPQSAVVVVNAASCKVVGRIQVGHTAMAPVVSPDGRKLFVCNRFDNDVSIVDLSLRREICRIAVEREPVAAALTRNGKFLLVANHLQNGRADLVSVSATVSVIDVDAGNVIKKIRLPNGSTALNDIETSPDGKYAAVSHLVAGFNRPATHVFRGWMNANALTIISLASLDVRNTVLLDSFSNGAANPWGLGWSDDGSRLIVAHSGTHDVSVIDFRKLLNHAKSAVELEQAYAKSGFPIRDQQANGFPFIVGQQRIKLGRGDLGPRAVVVAGKIAYVANYFSDTISLVDLSASKPRADSFRLGPEREMTGWRKGEFYFNDARICLQGWQSCASCHPGDARSDGMNWDLLNDGVGNPKNTKSLLLAHDTPPAMSLGVRTNAQAAVRAGIKYILFSDQPEEVALAIDEYLKSLRPVPSPHLVNGKFGAAAERGKGVFRNAGCAECHPEGLFTDLQTHNVGTRASFDKQSDEFDTPTLVELWRTAPYLHDGSATDVRDIVTTRNPKDEHGRTSDLSDHDIDDLCDYLLSL